MTFDIAVIGAGHAGCEAAWAAARMGARVALCTPSRETVALMPCNPAIGGTAKGHLVREIDALGGLMGRAIDATGLQFKILNRSRGPAVWSPRGQADKARYAAWMRSELDLQPAITWVLGRVGRILTTRGGVVGLALEDGRELRCDAVVGSANNQLASPADAERLRHRGVVYAPDFVANAGGVINIAEEPHGYDHTRAYERIASIHDTLLQVFERADVDGITTAAAADRLAEERIASVSHTRLIRTGR